MTTARVLDSVIKGAADGAVHGATTAVIGTAAVKVFGMLASTPFSQVIKVSMLGTALTNSVICGINSFFNPAIKKTPIRLGDAGFNTFILTAAGLLGEALTYTTVGSDRPPLQLTLALFVGNAIVCYAIEEAGRKKLQESEVKRPAP